MEKRERVRKRGKGLGKEGKGLEKRERVWKRGKGFGKEGKG